MPTSDDLRRILPRLAGSGFVLCTRTPHRGCFATLVGLGTVILLLAMTETSPPTPPRDLSPEPSPPAVLEAPSPTPAIDWSRNIGLLILETEREIWGDYVLLTPNRQVTVDDNVRLLEALLDEAEARLDTPVVRQAAPPDQLWEIHLLLTEWGFTYRDYASREYELLGYHLIHHGLARREIDCSTYVVLYLAIAERLGLPLVGLSLPEHVALRWDSPDGSSFNWEPTVPSPCDDGFYRQWKHISPEAEKTGAYLAPLSKQEVLGIALYERGLTHSARGDYGKALAVAHLSLSLAPRHPDAYNLHGLVLAAEGDYEQALASFDQAIQLDPSFAHAYFNRAGSRLALGQRDEACIDLGILCTLDRELCEELMRRVPERNG